jgi:hypothetical protein
LAPGVFNTAQNQYWLILMHLSPWGFYSPDDDYVTTLGMSLLSCQKVNPKAAAALKKLGEAILTTITFTKASRYWSAINLMASPTSLGRCRRFTSLLD